MSTVRYEDAPSTRTLPAREAARIARAWVDSGGGSPPPQLREAVRSLLAQMGTQTAPKNLVAIGKDVFERARAGEKEFTALQVVAAYAYAHHVTFGCEDQTLTLRAVQSARMRALELCSKEFKNSLEAIAFIGRAVRFWNARARAKRWPSPDGTLPTFDRLTHPCVLDAHRRGEIDREL